MGCGGVGVLLLEGDWGKLAVLSDGEDGSSGVCEPDVRIPEFPLLLKAIERRVRSARDGRGVWLAGVGGGIVNSGSSSHLSCFDGSRSIGDADTVGMAKFELLPSKSLLASR